MGLVPRLQTTAVTQCKIKNLHRDGIILSSDDQLIITLPDSRALKVIARSVLLALAIVTSPWLGSMVIWDSSLSYTPVTSDAQIPGESLLDLLVHDLSSEGLFKSGDKALLVSRNGDGYEFTANGAQILSGHGMDLVSESDSERQNSIPDATFDFIFASDFLAGDFIDRILKTGGMVAVQLSNNPLQAFHKPPNYKIVYLRQFESTVLALKKTGLAETNSSPTKRRLCNLSPEAKKAALNGLEDVLLEPPRASSMKQTNKYLKRTKYLPDLMGDSLEQYPRRLFIDVGLPDKNSNWFAQNYPTRNRDFEMYKIDTVNEEGLDEGAPQITMSDWLGKNVKEEEYVVMKAEAGVVEELMKNKAICLVDELFLECEYQSFGRRKKKSKRAYWECLALYGRLRDEGVAVHQWWG